MIPGTLFPRALAAVLLALALSAAPGHVAAKDAGMPKVMDGDIIFQVSGSAQSRAIRLATRSAYSHCGIVFHKNGKPYVYEAVGAMALTPLDAWIRNGIRGRYLLMRLKNRDEALDDAALASMRNIARGFAAKRYDVLFRWSDDTLYCSELVWKIYARGANIRLAEPRPFKEYTLDNPEVRALIKKRYGNRFSPDEKAVAPSDLAASPLLEKVAGN